MKNLDFLEGNDFISNPKNLSDEDFKKSVCSVFYNFIFFILKYSYMGDTASITVSRLLEEKLNNISTEKKGNLIAYYLDDRFISVLALFQANLSHQFIIDEVIKELSKDYDHDVENNPDFNGEIYYYFGNIASWFSTYRSNENNKINLSIIDMLIKIENKNFKKFSKALIKSKKKIEEKIKKYHDFYKTKKNGNSKKPKGLNDSEVLVKDFLRKGTQSVELRAINSICFIPEKIERSKNVSTYLYDLFYSIYEFQYTLNKNIDDWSKKYFLIFLTTLNSLCEKKQPIEHKESEPNSINEKQYSILINVQKFLFEIIKEKNPNINPKINIRECSALLASFFYEKFKHSKRIQKKRDSCDFSETVIKICSHLYSDKNIKKEKSTPEEFDKSIKKYNSQKKPPVPRKKSTKLSNWDKCWIAFGVFFAVVAIVFLVYLSLQTFGVVPALAILGGKLGLLGFSGEAAVSSCATLVVGFRKKIASFLSRLFSSNKNNNQSPNRSNSVRVGHLVKKKRILRKDKKTLVLVEDHKNSENQKQKEKEKINEGNKNENERDLTSLKAMKNSHSLGLFNNGNNETQENSKNNNNHTYEKLANNKSGEEKVFLEENEAIENEDIVMNQNTIK